MIFYLNFLFGEVDSSCCVCCQGALIKKPVLGDGVML